MNGSELIERIRAREISRRDLLTALGGLGLAVGVTALGGRAARAAAGSATYFTWGGYDDDGLFEPYIAKHGGPPNYSTFGDAEEAFTKLKAGYVVDVVHPCSNDVPRWKASGMFRPIDTGRLANFSTVFPRLSALPEVRDADGQWFVPFEWGATSITYRTDEVDLGGKAESWEMLFDPKYKGRVAVIDSAADTWYVMAIYAGVDMSKPLNDADIAKVNAVMERLRPQVRIFTSDMTSLAQSMASGEIVMAVTWNETPVTLHGEGHPVRFASPKEGSLTWACGLMMHKDAPDPDGAHDIIDAMLAPETGKYVIEEYGYGHSNAASFEKVDKEVLARLGLDVDPAAYLQAGVFPVPQPDEVETRINRDFEAIKTGF